MIIKKLTIEGLRGFSNKTEINFALPDKTTPGSGLTILVGPNNSGKSTIIEAIHLFSSNAEIVPLPLRNIINNNKVFIEIEDLTEKRLTIKSKENSGAFVYKQINDIDYDRFDDNMNIFILSNKRNFSSTFSHNYSQNRRDYKGNVHNSDYRSENNINHDFGSRLLKIEKNRELFDKCLEKVLTPLPNWSIEAQNRDNLFLQFIFNDIKHNSNGAGDGYINIFNIVDALYDSEENNIIFIDEPEISLHPDLQRKLFLLLVEYSKDKQIVIATHSPYFMNWIQLSNKTKMIRFKKEENSIKTFELSDSTREDIITLLKDFNQPHILSLDSNEIFFLNDQVILTEGQEDVICYKNIFEKYNYKPNASFFGWGAGGESKISNILNILKDLGYRKVFVILDNDKRKNIKKLKTKYGQYEFYAIACDDVRNKTLDRKIQSIIKKIKQMGLSSESEKTIIEYIESKYVKEGLIENIKLFSINPKFESDILNLIDCMDNYFCGNSIRDKDISTMNEYVQDNENNDEKARQLLDEWINKNKLFEMIQRKYKKFEFNSGDGGEISFKKFAPNKYYAIIEQSNNLSQYHTILINYYFVINVSKNSVKLIKKRIITNTLPLNAFEKFFDRLFLNIHK